MSCKNKKQSYNIDITDMNNLGNGITRIDGKVVFVKHGVYGDSAEIQIIKETSDYCIARIEKLTAPSKYRTDSRCLFSKRCGSCVYTEISREFELELKKKTVINELRKNGLNDIEVLDTVRAGGHKGYRNKIQLPVGKDRNGKTITGYYAGHSHEIISCNSCALQPDIANEIVSFVRSYSDREDWSASTLRHIYLRLGTDCNGVQNIMLCLVAGRKPVKIDEFADDICEKFPQISGILLNYNTEETNVILGDRFETIRGRDYIYDCLCGLNFKISPQSFYQVNHDAAESAYRIIAEKINLLPGESLLDLYCGIGTIGLTVASQTKGVYLTGIEIVPEAVQNAEYNAAANGFDVCSADSLYSCRPDVSSRAAFICGSADNIPDEIYDAAIIDPPRKGCSADLIDKLAELSEKGCKRIVYMSCNPATLARDLVLLRERGITAEGAVTPVDMFPGTGHVECIVLLKNR